MGVATFFTSIAVTTALAGLELVGVFVGLAGAGAAAAICRYAPDVVFNADVDPKAIVTRSEVPGMNDNVYARRFAIHAAREDLREEKIEQYRKKQERKAKSNRQTF